MDKNIGKKLDGRYEITELIGIGGMADVYKAVDIIDDRIVAVKILKNEFAENEDFIRRFRNESKAIAVLSHPNIVKIIDVGFSEKMQYIVMEYIDGITLKEFIEQQGVLKWKDSVHFIIQILRALQHAHDRGIVHRDIKPQNIMLFPDGTIKVMDFGIARFAREEGKTISDKAIGSVHYISPEQARGDITDEKSDIYSVGVMLYEMLTGVKPFDADNPVAVALMHMQNTAKPPREINDSIPEGLQEIVIRAMQKDTSKRYQTASEMIKDIEEFKKNPSIVFEYKYISEKTQYYNTAKISKATGYHANSKGNYNKDDYKKDLVVKSNQPTKKEYYEGERTASKSSYFIVTLTAIAAVVVIIAFIFVAWVVLTKLIPKDTKEVGNMPNLIGFTYQDVKTNYADAFTLAVKNSEYSSDYPEGVIVDQSISEGNEYIIGKTTVDVVVSKGPQMVTITNVYDLDAVTAQTMIENLGLTVQLKSVVNEAKKNTVIETQPARNESVIKGSTVILVVSRGPEEQDIIMPDVVGKTREVAEQMLSSFKNVTFQTVDSIEEKDRVLEQSVSATDENGSPSIVSPQTPIIIKISSGSAPEEVMQVTFSVPDYVTGEAQFKAYINGNVVGEQTVDNIEYVSTVTIDVSGSEYQKVIIEAINPDTNKSTQIGIYNVDFLEKTVTEVSFDYRDFQGLFYSGSNNNTTQQIPEMTDSNSTENSDDWWNEILNGSN